ncbi:MAG: helicase-exonuclease AddAB subunit AddA [Defluviitaleaceae bacterium]|nr:helicase-exonuclease AddAB subunit AddA [Defluviitaleaceae bacterium]
MNFTDEQQQAIDTRADNILVAAAAGSGKTRVLVERVLKLITEKEGKEATDIDRLLVVTFTEAAAAEMKERITKSLTSSLDELEKLEKSEKTENDDKLLERLLRQSARMPAANISTIHAFCLRLVKDNFHRIDLDPGFRIGDQTELNLLQSQVMETLFEESYAKEVMETPSAMAVSFKQLVEAFGGGKTKDNRLDKLIRRLFDFIESLPFPEETINKYIDIFNTPLDDSLWLDIIKEEMEISLNAALNTVQRAYKLCKLPDGPEKYLFALQEDEDIIRRLQKLLANNVKLDKLYDAFIEVKHSTIYSYRGKEKEATDEDLRLKVKDLRDKEIKQRIERMKKRFLFTDPGKMREDICSLQPVIKSLFDLTMDYRTRYSEEKRLRNLVDFSDLEHFAIQILWQGDFTRPSELTPSPVALALSTKFHEVLVDEYQDTNEVQERILSAFTFDNRRFMVGDVKQSIYGFRHAQPKLFLNKIDNPDVHSVILSRNFRSRKNVLDAINFFFYRLMRDPEYNDKAALYPGAVFPETKVSEKFYTTELHVVEAITGSNEDDEDFDENEDIKGTTDALTLKIRHEARIIARRIGELIESSAETDRPISYKDIVILTRSAQSISTILTEELKLQDINAVAETPGGFFETPEIMIALSLLKIVDNPRQDIDLLAVLRLYDFTPDQILEIRLHGDSTGDTSENVTIDYYDCLLTYLESGENENLCNRIQELLNNINHWRKKAIILPISRLIGLLYEETLLPYRFGLMSGGAVRQANLRLLLEKAIRYETTSFTGLFHFVRYIEWLQAHSEDEPAAMILPEDESVVKVMTIHKSKGLEFPVVFVSMLGRQFNQMDEKMDVILHPALGIGATYTDLEQRTRSNTISRLALALLRKREAVAEELRVLYVAMTRAKEKLILTGCVTDLDTRLEKWQNVSSISDADDRKRLPDYALRDAKCYLDWLMPCVMQDQNEISWQEHRISVANISSVEPTSFMASIGTGVVNMPYHHDKKESLLPSKLAISELKRIFALETSPDSISAYEKEVEFEAPAFYKQAAAQITPIQMGILLHTIVEHMDIHRDIDTHAIRELINSLAEKKLITQEESQIVDIKKLERFVASPLADRMRSAKQLYREIPFVIGLSPDDIYNNNITDATILVHGIIDCYFETPNGEIVLVDFKNSVNPETLHIRYATQMKIYRKAIEQATGKPVSESLFYNFG